MLTSRFDAAVTMARLLHASQLRKETSIPYISHLLGVASIALEHGADEELAIAALLHDAAEDAGGESALALIQREFGDRVADVVRTCSDTFESPKPPWRPRKAAYIDHLSDASSDALLVSASDKLHNARSIVTDLRTHGADLWGRFSGGRESVWYYESLVSCYERSGRVPTTLVRELRLAVEEMSSS